VDGLAYPLYHPTACSHQTRGQGFLPGVVLSHHVAVDDDASLGNAKSPGLDICGGNDRLGTCVIEFYMECIAFTRICVPYVLNHYYVYACIPRQAAILDGDGMDPSTRVYVVRCAWAPATTSYFIRQ
jgi:hypothetical protein